jgi:hypothetical protein
MAVIYRPPAFNVLPLPPGAQRRRPPVSFMNTLVILAAVVALALMLVPSLGERPETRRIDRARADCISIGAAILRFQADTGLAPKWRAAADAVTAGSAGVTVLSGPGRLPRERVAGEWTMVPADEISRQLGLNIPGYAVMASGVSRGWNGPYLAPSDLGPDPWNNRYFVNVGWLELAGGNTRREGLKAVWVLSAGPNGVIETPLVQDADRAGPGGDDVVYRIQ